MKKTIKCEIEIDDDRHCSLECQFNNFNLCLNMDWYTPIGHQHLLQDENGYLRCKQCLESEVKDET